MAHTHKPSYRLQIVDFSSDCIDIDSYVGTFDSPDDARTCVWESFDLLNDYQHSGFIRLVKVLPNGIVKPFMLVPYGSLIR